MNYLAVDIGNSFLGSSNFLKKTTDVGTLASIVASNALIIAGIIFLFFLVFAGITLIGASGSNNPEQLEKGKKAVTTALIGFIVVFAAYWIVKLVGQITGVGDLL